MTEETKDGVWFIYDGDCPVCHFAATSLRIKKSVGKLTLLDARVEQNHPLLRAVQDRKLDLDEGMVLIYQDSFFHGQDALHVMAFLGSGSGWFNRLNALLFKSKTAAKFSYPILRFFRNGLLRFVGVDKIRNLDLDANSPIFKTIFGEAWNELPEVMKDHYALRPFSDDIIKVEGHLNVKVSPLVSLMARLTGLLVPYSGKNIPTTVVFHSDRAGGFHFKRTFSFPDKGDVHFNSRMEWVKENELIEWMRFGIGWRIVYAWGDGRVSLTHRGYVWRIFGFKIPLPLEIMMGRGFAEEYPVSEDTFRMWTHAKHRWFGPLFGYDGEFKITDVSCDPV